MKKLLTFCFILLAAKNWAQCANTVSPVMATVSCAGGGSALSFTASSFNPTTSVVHNWYSPISPFPGGHPIYTSTNAVSVLSGTFSPGVYKVVTTDINNACSDTAVFTITSPDAYPTFGISSPTNYSVACAPLNSTTLSIINPVSTMTPPSTCSFTFLPPFFAGTLAPAPFGGNTSTITTIAGTWSVIVRDNTNNCRVILPVPILQNTIAPNVSASMATRTLMCNTPTILATGTSTTPNTVISWVQPVPPPSVPFPTIVIGPGSGPNTSSTSLTYANYTVVATNTVNACVTNSVIVISQNFRQPYSNPVFAAGSPTVSNCVNPVMLATGNSSCTSGGAGAAITNTCWALAGQAPVCGQATYSLNSPGLYNLTVQDSYNGCTGAGSIFVGSGAGTLVATYAHTVGLNGLVNFSNTSVGTDSNTVFSWNFGDGYTGSGITTGHTYSANGAYPVSLALTNGAGCASALTTQYVNISGFPCVANANFVIAPTPTPQYWSITPSYPYNVTAALWSWGDGATSNQLYASHSYSAAGTYSICLSVTVTCGASTSTCSSQYISRSADNSIVNIQVVVPPLVGINTVENEDVSYSLYPNPNAGEFSLRITSLSAAKTKLSIFDLFGHVVYESSDETLNGELTKNIDLSGKSNGVYFIKINCGDRFLIKKLVINK